MVNPAEIERVKKMLSYRLEENESADAVQLLDKLYKICRSQAKFITEVCGGMVSVI